MDRVIRNAPTKFATTGSMVENTKDRNNFVYLSMVMFGLASVLPFVFLITADNYWKFRFRDPTMINPPKNFKTYLQKTFSSYLIIASKIPLVLFLFLNLARNAKLSPEVRIYPSLVVNAVVLSLQCGLACYDFDKHQMEFLGITLGSVATVNVASAFLQGSFSGIASCLPPRYVGAFSCGQGISSIAAAIAQVLSLLAAHSPTVSALIYFAVAVAILLITIMTFAFVRGSDFYKFHLFTQVGRSAETKSVEVSYRYLFSKLWKHTLTVAFTCWVSATINPSLEVMIVQSNHIIPGKFFVPIFVFLLPSIGDFLGRLVGLRFTFNTRNGWLLVIFSVLRFALIPLMMCCNLQPRLYLPVLFKNDIIFIIIAFIVMFSNGYLITVAVVEGPKLVEVRYQETAGSVLAFGLGLGLLLGSVSTLGVTSLV